MKSGIYVLASLDGSPLAPEDRDLLGLRFDERVNSSATFAATVVDEHPARAATDRVDGSRETLLFLGFLNEPEMAQELLRLPTSPSPAVLCGLGLDRFGAEAAWHLLGDYSFVRWHSEDRELSLFASQRVRDQLYWATNGRHIAVSPDQLLLTKLSWVGRRINPQGFAMNVSDYRLRRYRTTETMWTGVSRVPAGWCVRIKQSSSVATRLSGPPEAADWSGTYAEAVEELTRVGRRVIGQQMRRNGRTTFLLSGGLDSSLTTLLGSMERKDVNDILCLTSVAPRESAVPDEWSFSKMVADAVHVSIHPIYPNHEKDHCRPSDDCFAHFGMPVLAFRQHLYEAFERSALSLGSHFLVDGGGGEFSVSAPRISAAPSTLRRLYLSLRSGLRSQTRRHLGIEHAFSMRFASGFIQELPPEWRAAVDAPFPPEFSGTRKGWTQSVRKSAEKETSGVYGTRFFNPYFDFRLLRLAASLPSSFFVDRATDRKLARSMLSGHVPNQIINRTSGLPISPTFMSELRLYAETAKARIPLYRSAGIDRYLNLDWLSNAIEAVAQGGNPYSGNLVQTQITAMAAEFLLRVS